MPVGEGLPMTDGLEGGGDSDLESKIATKKIPTSTTPAAIPKMRQNLMA